MIATPVLEQVRDLFTKADVVLFDGYDVLGKDTTDLEPRVFRYDPARARFVDWDLYEVLQHDYDQIERLQDKCYLHMKLVKREWLHKEWSSPNLLASRSVPETGAAASSRNQPLKSWVRRAGQRLFRRKFTQG